MAKGRKNGCPVNVRDWKIEIQDKSQVNETWVRIHGLTSMSRKGASTTEDGSAATDLWEEPYVTKRNVKLTLSGKLVVDAGTGTPDSGQDMLDSYAENGSCDGEATLRLTDPFGHCIVADFIVTDTSDEANETENTVSWDLSQVGEAETLPYVQVSSIALKDGSTALSTLSIAVGDTPKIVTVDFTPTNSSNKRFRVNVSNRHYVGISNITDNTFTITPLAAGTATVTVTTVNGAKTASVAVTVTAGS